MASTVFPVASTASTPLTQKVQEFTATGNFVVPSNTSCVQVILVGGGGGGGYRKTSNTNPRPGSAGGGGQYIDTLIPVTPGNTYTVTIGAGGAASTSLSSNGGVGSNTTFGSLATAVGNGGGSSKDENSGTGTFTSQGGGGWAVSDSAGGGGGAGGPATMLVQNSAGNINYVRGTLTSTKIPNAGSPNLSGTSTGYHIAGPGLNGFGNGGAGGYSNDLTLAINSGSFCYYSGTGSPGYFNSQTSTNVAAVAPTANTGDGGHGAACNNVANSVAGTTAGASGYAKVIYWS